MNASDREGYNALTAAAGYGVLLSSNKEMHYTYTAARSPGGQGAV